MKRILITTLAVILWLPIIAQTSKPTVVHGNVTEEYDGYVMLTNKIPYPLGRYVQLTSDKLPFNISNPNAGGISTITIPFTFEILRHVPNLEYCSFHISDPFWLKFKTDQNAVEQLSVAVANNTVATKTVKWYNSITQEDMPPDIFKLSESLNGQNCYFEDSSIYVLIPVNNVSMDLDYMLTKKPCIKFYTDDNPTMVRMSIDMELIGLSQSHIEDVYVIVKTGNGKFIKTFDNVKLTAGFNKTKEIRINGREMDTMLSNPVYIEIVRK